MPKTTKPSDKLAIVQFIHPGREFQVRNKNGKYPVSVPWVGGDCSGSSGHSRRFVSHEGNYVNTNGRLKTARLAFWTEWEACSVADVFPAANDDHLAAHWVHTVKTPLMNRPGPQNTDPCAFGSTFKYCCCQQTENGLMRNLSPGSLVLFGAHMDNRFFLDTVFVVADKGVPYDASDAKQLAGLGTSKEYRSLSLDRLLDGKLTFYRGKTFRSAVKGELYSFVPSRIFSPDDSRCGKRFELDLATLNTLLPKNSRRLAPNLNQRFKPVEAEPETVLRVWNRIVEEVRKAGFVPGVHFDWPK